MTTMTLEELYSVGTSFETEVGRGTRSERERIPKNMGRIQLSEALIERITRIEKSYKFLIAGEIWCPDFQLNGSVIKRMTEINSKLELSIISMARGRKFLLPILGKSEMKWPAIVIMNEDYEVIGVFEERPKIVKGYDFETIKREYYKGQYLLDTVNEVLEMIG